MNRSVLVLFAAPFLMIASAQTANAQDACPRPRLISVTGTAEINLPPDEVTLRMGIDTRDKDLSVAKSKHDERSKKVISLARSLGVEAKDISTTMLSMEPDYSEEKIPRFLGYEVSQTIAITLKDLSKYESLMTKLLDAGVNRVGGINFHLGDPRKIREEARAKALRAAKEKAVAMAAELGQTIGKPWEISEAGTGWSGISGFGMANTVGGIAGHQAEDQDSTVAPGQVTIRASVNVSFLLE
jgi:uncharacterized protein YggE